VDSKATLRPVVESDLDLLALARWFADQRLTGGEHASGRHLQAACPHGATQYAGRVLRTSCEAGTFWPTRAFRSSSPQA